MKMDDVLVDLATVLFHHLRNRVLDETGAEWDKTSSDYLLMTALGRYLVANGIVFTKPRLPEE